MTSHKKILCMLITCYFQTSVINAQEGDDVLNSIPEDVANFRLPFEDEIDRMTKESIYTKIFFILYNEHYPKGKTFKLENYKSINIGLEKTTKILIHGWNNDRNSGMPTALRDEYEKHNEFNVIIIDWSELSKTILYPLPANGTTVVGEHLADLLLELYKNSGNQVINVHLIGFSLGAHVAGFAGRKLKQHNFFVDRITGLDPAKPLIYNGLQSTDAQFVDVIHTSSGILGKNGALGVVDFYPNGGVAPQPGCLPLLPITCSHSKSWRYFSETINKPTKYLAYQCDSYFYYLLGLCTKTTYMGEEVSRTATGVFYLDTDVD